MFPVVISKASKKYDYLLIKWILGSIKLQCRMKKGNKTDTMTVQQE